MSVVLRKILLVVVIFFSLPVMELSATGPTDITEEYIEQELKKLPTWARLLAERAVWRKYREYRRYHYSAVTEEDKANFVAFIGQVFDINDLNDGKKIADVTNAEEVAAEVERLEGLGIVATCYIKRHKQTFWSQLFTRSRRKKAEREYEEAPGSAVLFEIVEQEDGSDINIYTKGDLIKPSQIVAAKAEFEKHASGLRSDQTAETKVPILTKSLKYAFMALNLMKDDDIGGKVTGLDEDENGDNQEEEGVESDSTIDASLIVSLSLSEKFSPGSERLEMTYTLKDTLDYKYNKLEIFKIGEKDTTLVKSFSGLPKGKELDLKEVDKKGWNGKDKNQKHLAEGNYLVTLTASKDDKFKDHFEVTKKVEAEIFTKEVFNKIFSKGDPDFIKESFPHLKKYMTHFEINTPLRISHFLAQIGGEVGYFKFKKYLKENLKYSACNIKHNLCQKCYSKQGGDKEKCPTKKGDCDIKYSGDRKEMCNNPDNYKYDDEKIAKAAYNTYMGRGFIHLTWKENYQSNYNYLTSNGLTPKNFISDAKHLSDDVETAAMSACGFFKQKGCLSHADNDSFDGVQNIVNKYDTNKSKKKTLLSTVKAQILTLK